MKTQLHKKQIAFLTIIIAMLFSSAAHAQIVYTDVIPDQTCSGNCTYNLDLNNDGVTDFQLETMSIITCDGHTSKFVRVLPDTFNRVLNSNAYPAKLDASAQISPGNSWNPALYPPALSTDFWFLNYNGCVHVSVNHWIDASDGYIGLEIKVAGEYYYGWARLSVGFGTVTIRDYAYNNCIGQSIYAGQTSGGFPLTISGDTSICSGDATTLAASGGNSYLWSTGDTIASILVSPAQTSAYTVQISNDTSVCSVSTTVTVNEVDTLVTLSDDTLKAHATNALYQWIDCASELPVAGATSHNFSPLQNGIYAVQVTQNGCTDTSSCYTVIATTISGNSFESFRGLFPNPASGIITLLFSSSEKRKIHITNILGQIVFAEEINSAKKDIEVSEFPAGIYVVSAQTSTQKIEKKFLKQ